jgi:hypothetical protein
MNVKCSQCNKKADLLTAFTKDKVCGKCTRKNHQQFLNQFKPKENK